MGFPRDLRGFHVIYGGLVTGDIGVGRSHDTHPQWGRKTLNSKAKQAALKTFE